MIGEEEELIPSEVILSKFVNHTLQISNLILDDLSIPNLTDEDRAFLEEFVNLEKMAMNNTSLKSTKNFPEANGLQRVIQIYIRRFQKSYFHSSRVYSWS